MRLRMNLLLRLVRRHNLLLAKRTLFPPGSPISNAPNPRHIVETVDQSEHKEGRTYLGHGRGRFDRVAVGLDGGAGAGRVCFLVLAVDLGGASFASASGDLSARDGSRKWRQGQDEHGLSLKWAWLRGLCDGSADGVWWVRCMEMQDRTGLRDVRWKG